MQPPIKQPHRRCPRRQNSRIWGAAAKKNSRSESEAADSSRIEGVARDRAAVYERERSSHHSNQQSSQIDCGAANGAAVQKVQQTSEQLYRRGTSWKNSSIGGGSEKRWAVSRRSSRQSSRKEAKQTTEQPCRRCSIWQSNRQNIRLLGDAANRSAV